MTELSDNAGVAQSSEGTSGFPMVAKPSLPKHFESEIRIIRDLFRRGLFSQAATPVDRLMNTAAGAAYPEVLLIYGEYLLGRARPRSAGRALMPLLRGDSVQPQAQVLLAEALADTGKADRALKLAERVANARDTGSVEAAALFDALYKLKGPEGDRAAIDAALAEMSQATGLNEEALFVAGRPGQLDALLERRLTASHRDRAGSVEAWAYFLGQYCASHLGAEWSWRRRLADSTISIPLGDRHLELTPGLWARWRLERPEHRLGWLIRLVLEIKGAAKAEIQALVGSPAAEDDGSIPAELMSDPLTAALQAARRRATRGEILTGLGLVTDCPLARIRVPLVVDDGNGPLVVLFRGGSSRESFLRFLDMMCLSHYVKHRWCTGDDAGDASEEADGYAVADPGVRAALAARRLCTEDPAKNARWAVSLAGIALDTTLDGSPESLLDVEDLIRQQLRPGGRQRWGALFDNRFAILFLLTCYAGEVLRARYGGRWGGDRLTGRPIGPTAGLELPQLRFNLGAKILKTFYRGHEFVPALVEYARRAVAHTERAPLGEHDESGRKREHGG